MKLDQRDRRILGVGLVLCAAFAVIVLTVAAVLGVGVRVFLLTSGIGG